MSKTSASKDTGIKEMVCQTKTPVSSRWWVKQVQARTLVSRRLCQTRASKDTGIKEMVCDTRVSQHTISRWWCVRHG